MVTCSLNVEGRQVSPRQVRGVFGEEIFGHLLGDELVDPLDAGVTHSPEEAIHTPTSGVQHATGFEEHLQQDGGSG